jgi:hypothetical protein
MKAVMAMPRHNSSMARDRASWAAAEATLEFGRFRVLLGIGHGSLVDAAEHAVEPNVDAATGRSIPQSSVYHECGARSERPRHLSLSRRQRPSPS